jgi:hypothetical protein
MGRRRWGRLRRFLGRRRKLRRRRLVEQLVDDSAMIRCGEMAMVRVTADEAKRRFGELLRDVAAGEETVLIEKDGSHNEYTRLQEKVPQLGADWKEHVDRLQEKIAEELRGRPLPPAEDVIRRMREERDEQILGSLR